MQRTAPANSGFTLIELLIVMVVLGILFIVGLFLFDQVKDNGYNKQAQAGARAALIKATTVYVSNSNSFGSTTAEVVTNLQGQDSDGLTYTATSGALADKEVYVLLDDALSGYTDQVGQQLTLCSQSRTDRVYCLRVNQSAAFPVSMRATQAQAAFVAAAQTHVAYSSAGDITNALCALPQPGTTAPDPFPAVGCHGVPRWSAGSDDPEAVPEPTSGNVMMIGSGNIVGDGVGAAVSTFTPVSVAGALAGKEIAQLSIGNGHACALDTDGKAYCWGDGSSGKLGHNATSSSNVPVAVYTAGALSGKTLTQISTSLENTCAIDSEGAAYCWGQGGPGQIGNGLTTSSNSRPVAVSTAGVLAGQTVTKIAAGTSHTCAIASGRAYCWGRNTNGVLGDGTTTDRLVPVAVSTAGVLAGKTVTDIAAGYSHTCVLADGAPYCWGMGSGGRLGNASQTTSYVPVAVDVSGVLAGKTLTTISGSFSSHTCVLDTQGRAYCWGIGGFGRLGDGGTSNQTSPVAVDASGVLAGKTIIKLSVTNTSALVKTSDGGLYEWGYRASTTNASPVAVTAPSGNPAIIDVAVGGGSTIGVVAAP